MSQVAGHSAYEIMQMPQKTPEQVISELHNGTLEWNVSCFNFLIKLFSGGSGPFPFLYPVWLLYVLEQGGLTVEAVPYKKVPIPDEDSLQYREFRRVRKRRNESEWLQELRWWAYNWLKEQGEPEPRANWQSAHFSAPNLRMKLSLSKYETDWIKYGSLGGSVDSWAHICEDDDIPPLVFIFKPTQVLSQLCVPA